MVEERRRAVQAGDDRHRLGGERVPAADSMDEGFVAGEQLRHLDDIEDRIAAHPDIGDAQRHRRQQQRVDQPMRRPGDGQSNPWSNAGSLPPWVVRYARRRTSTCTMRR